MPPATVTAAPRGCPRAERGQGTATEASTTSLPGPPAESIRRITVALSSGPRGSPSSANTANWGESPVASETVFPREPGTASSLRVLAGVHRREAQVTRPAACPPHPPASRARPAGARPRHAPASGNCEPRVKPPGAPRATARIRTPPFTPVPSARGRLGCHMSGAQHSQVARHFKKLCSKYFVSWLLHGLVARPPVWATSVS